jgi:hypothetical protein
LTTEPAGPFACTAIVPGTFENCGPAVSGGGGGGDGALTVTLNDALPVFPAASVAEHVTVVVPTRNVEPDGGIHVTVGLGGLVSSVAVAEKLTTAPAELVASTVMLPGTVTVGAVVSDGGGALYVTVTVALALFAAVSVHEIVVGPTLKWAVTLNSGAGPPVGVQVTSSCGSR